jgi:hypothetical protein
MSIVYEGLAPSDQTTVAVAWTEMLRALANPAQLDARIDRWFGTACPAAFRANMPRTLRKFRSSMNLCAVTVCCSTLDQRDIDTFGAAYHNNGAGGFAPINSYDPVSQPNLRLELDGRWNIGVPLYKSAGNFDSAFQTLAHELSHLLLATRDEPLNPPAASPKCYGEPVCTALATANDPRALTNADNWGYFIEDLRR